MNSTLIQRVELALGAHITRQFPMGVGFGLHGLQAKTTDGRRVAIKAALQDDRANLDIEGLMLRELQARSNLPVPEVYYADKSLLVMSWIDNDGGAIGKTAQRHSAELLAALHGGSFPYFGYEQDTLIGPLHQPNPKSSEWIPFFRDHRLLYMASEARKEGSLPSEFLLRLERLGDRLEDWLIEPRHPTLIHGDLWTGNVLVKGGLVAGFVDPAIYFADREIELAFTTMFGTFGAPFFDVYESLVPLEPGFHDIRRDIYNLYPTLVHVRLFGRSYLGHIERTLTRLGL